MNDVIVNPDNVNPHFQRPEAFGLKALNTCGGCPLCVVNTSGMMIPCVVSYKSNPTDNAE